MTVKYKVDDRSVMLLTTASKVSKIEAHESFRLGLKKGYVQSSRTSGFAIR